MHSREGLAACQYWVMVQHVGVVALQDYPVTGGILVATVKSLKSEMMQLRSCSVRDAIGRVQSVVLFIGR